MTAEIDGLVPPRDERLSLNKFAQREGIHLSTIHRWCQRGVVGRDGQRVRLRTVRIGGRAFVTADSLRQFLDATNREQPEVGFEATVTNPRLRRARADAAKQVLRGQGVRLKAHTEATPNPGETRQPPTRSH